MAELNLPSPTLKYLLGPYWIRTRSTSTDGSFEKSVVNNTSDRKFHCSDRFEVMNSSRSAVWREYLEFCKPPSGSFSWSGRPSPTSAYPRIRMFDETELAA